MKKFLWILGTVAALVIWTIVVAVFILAGLFFHRIITGQGFSGNISDIYPSIVLVGYVILIVLSRILWKRFTCRCSVCKKWGAMQRIQTKEVKSEAVSVLVTTERRARDGYVVETQDQYIPGTKRTYQDIYRCKFCGHEESCSRVLKGANL